MKKVAAAVIEKEGRVLIARRKKGDLFEGQWEFPGGALEPGETPEECLKREILEELEIEVEVGSFVCSSRYESALLSIELLAFRATYLRGEFKLRDHQEIQWVIPDEFERFKFALPDIPIAERLKKMTAEKR